MDIKNLNEMDDLVYKTMPRGKVSIVPGIKPQAAPAPAPVVPTAASVPMPSAPVPTHPSIMDGLHAQKPVRNKKHIIIATIAILVVLAGGAFAYLIMSKKDQSETANTPTLEETPTVVSAISDEWRTKFFNSAICLNLENCGDDADPDHDGMSNLAEYNSLTDPNNSDSDKDGLADGDEKYIFGYDPQNAVSSGKPAYPDDVEAKTKWNIRASAAFTDEDLTAIASNVKKYGFHNPTIATLGQELIDVYTNFGAEAATPTSAESSDGDTSDALDRDTQRADAIKQIGFALLAYKQTNSKYPNVTKFEDMITAIKPLLQSRAVNTSDPKNVAPYVYTYTAISAGADFKIGYYSETQNQQILLSAKEITALSVKDQATSRDTQRKADLESIATALETYSSGHMAVSDPDKNVFPSQATWKKDLVPTFIAAIPVDPQTKKDYTYTVTPSLDSYALQATLENPPTGKKGYLCAAEGCVYY
jgi:hypothetical protein